MDAISIAALGAARILSKRLSHGNREKVGRIEVRYVKRPTSPFINVQAWESAQGDYLDVDGATCSGCGNPIFLTFDLTGLRAGLSWSDGAWGDDRDFQCRCTGTNHHERGPFVPRSHPKPLCYFGRQHSWSTFINIPGHFACTACGVEDDERWWEGATGSIYAGPNEPIYTNVREGGWALRQPEAVASALPGEIRLLGQSLRPSGAQQPPSTGSRKPATIDEVRVGRNFLRVGDPVKVAPSKPGKRDGFLSDVLAIYGTDPVSVDVRDPYNGALRTVPITRVTRRRKPSDAR